MVSIKDARILIVEDDEQLIYSIEGFLGRRVKELYVANNGEEGLELYRKHSPDLVVTDIIMPIMRGEGLVSAIRETDTSTPILAVTAHTDNDILLKLINLHIFRYITKPFRMHYLIESIEEALVNVDGDNATILKMCKEDGESEVIKYYPDRSTVEFEDGSISRLTKTENKLFHLMAKNPTRLLTYENIEKAIWPDGAPSNEAMRALVKKLRNKTRKEFIINASGTGYTLNLCTEKAKP